MEIFSTFGNMEKSVNPEFLNARSVFLNALKLPAYAWPEYFTKCQQESGWSMRVFSTALFNEYSYLQQVYDIKEGKEKRMLENAGQTLPEDFGIDLPQITNGIVEGKLTRESLQRLLMALQEAERNHFPKPVFDAHHILTFTERMLLFIKEQFQVQIHPTGSARSLAKHLRKKGHTIEGDPEYIIYQYHFYSVAPILDFPLFQHELKMLLLTSRHPDKLKILLKPTLDIGLDVINIWNNHLNHIGYPSSTSEFKGKSVLDTRHISFQYRTLKMWYLNEDFIKYSYEGNIQASNHDLAVFVANVTNFIASFVMEEKDKKNNISRVMIAQLLDENGKTNEKN